ncbi:MAG: hypothetical protein AAGN35_17095 [Bacteroidota bacterium]
MKPHQILRLLAGLLVFGSGLTGQLWAQDSIPEREGWDERVFGTQLEIGYVEERSSELGGGILFKTAIEYRMRRVNHLFFRFDYDDYDVDFRLNDLPGLAREISGNTSFTDLLLGVGYRGGDRTLRFTGLVQSGVKLYGMPSAEVFSGQLVISSDARAIWTGRASLGLEYYFDKNFAAAVDVFHNRVLQSRDFWEERPGAWGVSIGLIGSFL